MRLKVLLLAIFINIFMFSFIGFGQNSRKFTISGYVTDIESGESLIGAGVLSGRVKAGGADKSGVIGGSANAGVSGGVARTDRYSGVAGADSYGGNGIIGTGAFPDGDSKWVLGMTNDGMTGTGVGTVAYTGAFPDGDSKWVLGMTNEGMTGTGAGTVAYTGAFPDGDSKWVLGMTNDGMTGTGIDTGAYTVAFPDGDSKWVLGMTNDGMTGTGAGTGAHTEAFPDGDSKWVLGMTSEGMTGTGADTGAYTGAFPDGDSKLVLGMTSNGMTGTGVDTGAYTGTFHDGDSEEKRGVAKDGMTDAVARTGAFSDGDSKVGVATNEFGWYNVSLDEGLTMIEYHYVGYEPKTIVINLKSDTVINVALTPSANLSEAIIVARNNAGIRSTNMSAIDVPISQVIKSPTLFGESDIIKFLQMLPGVQGGMEGTTGIHVRGGSQDENLVMLDGIPIYNIDHVLGIFSVFTPEAVKKVTFYKGAFPARYGGRISSIVDVRTNDGNLKETHGVVSVGMLTSRAHVEGPIKQDKTSFSLSFRGMHTLLYQPFIKYAMKDDAKANFYFYDANAKISHKFNDRNRLYLGVYNGWDKLIVDDLNDEDGGSEETFSRSADKYRIGWGNTIAALRLNHIFSNTLFSNTTVAFNNYRMSILNKYNTTYGIHYLSDYNYKYKSGITDGSARMDFEWTPNSSNSVRFGGEYTFHTFKPETSSFSNKSVESGIVQTDSTYNELDGRKMRGHEASVFIEDDIFMGERLSFNPGLHYTAFYTDGKFYGSLQPRLSARMDLGKGYAVKAAYSRMAQYVHLLTSTDISLPTDLWVPITKNIKPVIGDHYSIGAYYSGLKGWEFSLEGYYKKTKNIVEYQDGATVLGTSANWYDKVSMGEGRSYGAEVFIQKTLGKTTGFVSYTLSKSDRIFRDGMVNNGKWYPYKYDRRHNLVLSVFHKFSDRVDVAGNFVFTTGGTTTVPTRQIVVIIPGNTSTYDDYVPYKNNYRLPCSQRLNLGVNLHKQKRHGERIWNFSIYNVYNAMNPNLVYSDTDYVSNDGHLTTDAIRIKKITLLPFMPSISYTFKF